MYSYSTSSLIHEAQRIINQLQQNERNNANMLRSLANQLQNLAATENQATAMLQQLQTITNQLAMEASRTTQLAYQSTTPYEPMRTNVGSNVAPSPGSTYSSGLQSSHVVNTPPTGQT
jgi:hypothetical protein